MERGSKSFLPQALEEPTSKLLPFPCRPLAKDSIPFRPPAPSRDLCKTTRHLPACQPHFLSGSIKYRPRPAIHVHSRPSTPPPHCSRAKVPSSTLLSVSARQHDPLVLYTMRNYSNYTEGNMISGCSNTGMQRLPKMERGGDE